MKKFLRVGMGGSFDHFHAGHRHFLTFAASQAEKLFVGITNQASIQNKPFAGSLEDWPTRAASVRDFCQKKGIQAEVFELNDIYGPTLEPDAVDALCVTTETVHGAERINQTRQQNKLAQLPVSVCDLLPAEDGEAIHSVRIRKGELNREGKLYAKVFDETILLSPTQREFLSQPQGSISLTIDGSSLSPTYVVGDSCLEYFLTHNFPYQLGVFDKKRQRQEVTSPLIDALKIDMSVNNPPGQITHELSQAIKSCLAQNYQHLFVDGEEDLASVVLILLAPLQSRVIYGQPHQGMVEVTITESLKERLFNLFKKT
jgi:pantetheine-phosphate adenylyltransferase